MQNRFSFQLGGFPLCHLQNNELRFMQNHSDAKNCKNALFSSTAEVEHDHENL